MNRRDPSDGPAPIPFLRAHRAGNELANVERVLAADQWDSGGDATRACERRLETELGVGRALLTTSCTHALELAAIVLDLGPGDEVIVPAFTFVSTANAFALRGARLVFADIRPDTLNVDHEQVAALVTDRTRAIVPVHYAGIACEMHALRAIAEPRGIAIVEDNAHGLYGTFDGEPLGTFGALATLSFHSTKNFSCGEGGALLLNDGALVDRAEMARQKGTDRAQFLAGKVAAYSWQTLGSSYVMSELLAAVLLAQLDARDAIGATRAAIWDRYAHELEGWATREGTELPTLPAGCTHPAHIFFVLTRTEAERPLLIEHLARHGVHATSHYTALHISTMGQMVGSAPLGAPVTESAAARIVRLPLYPDLSPTEQERVIAAVSSFRSRAGTRSDRSARSA